MRSRIRAAWPDRHGRRRRSTATRRRSTPSRELSRRSDRCRRRRPGARPDPGLGAPLEGPHLRLLAASRPSARRPRPASMPRRHLAATTASARTRPPPAPGSTAISTCARPSSTAILRDHPRDLLALMFAHQADFFAAAETALLERPTAALGRLERRICRATATCWRCAPSASRRPAATPRRKRWRLAALERNRGTPGRSMRWPMSWRCRVGTRRASLGMPSDGPTGPRTASSRSTTGGIGRSTTSTATSRRRPWRSMTRACAGSAQHHAQSLRCGLTALAARARRPRDGRPLRGPGRCIRRPGAAVGPCLQRRARHAGLRRRRPAGACGRASGRLEARPLGANRHARCCGGWACRRPGPFWTSVNKRWPRLPRASARRDAPSSRSSPAAGRNATSW
jgi:hypothetical protein